MRKTHSLRSIGSDTGLIVTSGVFASCATSAIAAVAGVLDEPMIASTRSSVTRRRAFLVATVGSVASSSTISLTFSPPISVGRRAKAFFSGMPSEAAGPEAESETPMVMSANAAELRAKVAESATTSLASFMFPPIDWCGDRFGVGRRPVTAFWRGLQLL